MKFTAKYVQDNEIAQAVKVEADTMGSYTYLKDAWELYRRSAGELIGIYDEGHMIGIGRFTVLADNSGWLECLRVTPEYQRMGAGKMIYDEYLKLAEKYQCSSIAMYTGMKNIKSSSLAEKYDLYTVQVFHGYHLTPKMTETDAHFHPLTPDACEELMKDQETYNGWLSVSRTFYHFKPENLKDFASNGMVYKDEESGSIVIAGARFQHGKALHVALMSGDMEKCLAFVNNLAAVQSIGDLTFTLAAPNPLEEVLLAKGAKMDAAEIIVKERTF